MKYHTMTQIMQSLSTLDEKYHWTVRPSLWISTVTTCHWSKRHRCGSLQL